MRRLEHAPANGRNIIRGKSNASTFARRILMWRMGALACSAPLTQSCDDAFYTNVGRCQHRSESSVLVDKLHVYCQYSFPLRLVEWVHG